MIIIKIITIIIIIAILIKQIKIKKTRIQTLKPWQREHQVSCASNLLISVKYLILDPVCFYYLYYQVFLYHANGFQLAGHYLNLKYWE